jgi:hypothetical protein
MQWQVNASLAELEARHQGPDAIPEKGATTLMIRNMPRSYTAEAIMCELKTVSPRSQYDFVYLPWDNRRGSNISYAFLNFVDHESALRAFFALSGRMWSLVRTMKTCRVATAHIQGLPENLANYVANSGIQDDCPHTPTVFHNGKRVDLRLAVRLFCTGDMLQRAAEAVRASKMSLTSTEEQDDTSVPLPFPEARRMHMTGGHGNRQRISEANCAMEFRRSFQGFCQSVAQKDFSNAGAELSDSSEDSTNVQFWLRFRDLCIQFSQGPSVMPEFKVPQTVAADTQEHHIPRDGNSFSNDLASYLLSVIPSTIPHPPGLIRPKGNGKGRASPEDAAFNGIRSLLANSVQAPEEAFDHESSSRQFIEPSYGRFEDFSSDRFPGMPDEGRIPVPALLMNGRNLTRKVIQ